MSNFRSTRSSRPGTNALLDLQLLNLIAMHLKQFINPLADVRYRIITIMWPTTRVGNNLTQCIAFIDEMRSIAIEKARIYKAAREASFKLCERELIDKKTRNELIRCINTPHKFALQQISCLTQSTVRISSLMMAQPIQTRMLKAYLHSIAQCHLSSYYAGFLLRQESVEHFRLLASIYNSGIAMQNHRFLFSGIWCPITQNMAYPHEITAMHIVPTSITQDDIEYLWGYGQHADQGYGTLWGPGNGLMVHSSIQCALNNSRMVLVPAKESQEGEYEAAVLCEELKQQPVHGCSIVEDGERRPLRFADLHGRRLVWRNQARPDPTNLFFHYMASRWIRKRSDAHGWEDDAEKIPWKGRWPGCRSLNCGVMKLLADELGDVVCRKSPACFASIFEEHKALFTDEVAPQTQREAAVVIRLANALVWRGTDLDQDSHGEDLEEYEDDDFSDVEYTDFDAFVAW